MISDDLAVTENDLKNTNFLLQKLEEVSREIGIMIKIEKTEYISLSKSSNNKIRNLKGEDLKKVTDFKYLGSYVSPTKKDIGEELVSIEFYE